MSVDLQGTQKWAGDQSPMTKRLLGNLRPQLDVLWLLVHRPGDLVGKMVVASKLIWRTLVGERAVETIVRFVLRFSRTCSFSASFHPRSCLVKAVKKPRVQKENKGISFESTFKILAILLLSFSYRH